MTSRTGPKNEPGWEYLLRAPPANSRAALPEVGRIGVPDYSAWSYWRLLREKRKRAKLNMPAQEVRFEIDRRREKLKTWGIWFVIFSAVFMVVATIANLYSK
jgi:hypothetical protein